MNMKHMLILGLNVVALALCCAGTGTPVYVVTSKSSSYTITASVSLWASCVSVDPEIPSYPNQCKALSPDEIECSADKSRLMAGRAFTIISCLAFGVATMIAAARVFVSPNSALTEYTDKLPLFPAIAAFVFDLIAWALCISAFTAPGCDQKMPDGAKLGAGPILLIVAWVLIIGTIVVEFLLRGSGSAAATGKSLTEDSFTRNTNTTASTSSTSHNNSNNNKNNTQQHHDNAMSLL
jgi:hypothetical protein